MKKIIFLLTFFVLTNFANATNYYFSVADGNDSRTSVQAQSPATPWASISKLNSFFSSLAAGDSILFKRGETFYGSVVINKSGSSGNLIKIGAYGSGSNPIITGLSSVAGFINLGSNKWESVSAVSTLSTLKMVVINGVNTAMGRYPNVSSGRNGWLNYESHSGATQITDNQLTGTPNWTGAQAVIKTVNWVIDVGNITSHSGSVINYTPTAVDGGTSSEGVDGMSYFIQNDLRTLDEEGEWYYNPSTKKITVYHVGVSAPTGVQVANLSNLVNGNGNNYISFSNIDLKGSNGDLITLPNNTHHWSFTGCGIMFSGRDGLFSNTANNISITSCTIRDINNNGIMLRDQADNNTINYNTVTNIGIFPGMADQSIYFSMEGIHCVGDNFTCTGNSVSNVGIDGIRFGGSNVLINKNFVTNHCMVKTDAGGIYTWGCNGSCTYTNQVIEDNTIVNGSDLGVIGTWLELEELSCNGIYLDGQSQNVIVQRNNISHVNASGIYCNTPINVTIRDNTVYDCRYASIHINKNHAGLPNLNLTVKNNICVAKLLNTSPTGSNQRCFYYLSLGNDITSNIASIDSNVYARPIDNATANPISRIVYTGYSGPGEPATQTRYTLAAWKAAFPAFDQHSTQSPISISSTSLLRFEYNASDTNKTVALDANYIDFDSVSYPGTVLLAPYHSVALIKSGGINLPPTANGGGNLAVYLPATSITITGAGTDVDGTISAYSWAKISGPTGGTITNGNTATPTISLLQKGIYLFRLTVTDNNGATDTDDVTISVSSAIKTTVKKRSIYKNAY